MVELIGVTGGYGRQMAVQDFSLTLPSGEVAALVGPNGCGKSTLLRMAAGIVPPSAGQVLLKGRYLSGFSRRELGQLISYLPQSRPVPGISVQSMVMHGRFPYLGYPRRYRKEDWQMVQKAMEWAGVTHLAGRDMSRLSGESGRRCILPCVWPRTVRCCFWMNPPPIWICPINLRSWS